MQQLHNVPLERLKEELARDDPRHDVGDHWAYLMFGPNESVFLRDGQVQIDIRGLVFKPKVRMSRKGNIVIDL